MATHVATITIMLMARATATLMAMATIFSGYPGVHGKGDAT
jgi:hypothetical protein